MQIIASIIIPLITLTVIIYGLYKRVDIYTSFLKGIDEGLKLCLTLFPTMASIKISIFL